VDIQFPEDFRSVEQMLVVKDLLRVVCQERQIQENCQPVSIDDKEDGEEAMYSSFRDNVGVETVAQIDGVDVITFQIAVHDGEEDLEEQVDGVYQHSQQIEPCFSRHHEKGRLGSLRWCCVEREVNVVGEGPGCTAGAWLRDASLGRLNVGEGSLRCLL